MFNLIFTFHQQSFSYKGTDLPGLNKYKARVNVLAQGHNAMRPVRPEPAAPRSRAKHSTTEPLCPLPVQEVSIIIPCVLYLCPLGNFACFLCRLLTFSKSTFLKNSFRNNIRMTISSGLIWVQIVRKGYQQTILEGNELSNFNHAHTTIQWNQKPIFWKWDSKDPQKSFRLDIFSIKNN